MQAFISELRRRNVLRVAAFYAAAGWLLVQVATQVFPFFDIPNSTVRLVVMAIVLGFPFALLFSWFYELTPQGLKLESEVTRDESITRATGRRLDRWIIAVLGLAVVLLLADKLLLHRAAPSTASSAESGKSIAVLPFDNLSDDKANAYFAEGIQDEILTKLAGIGDLKVISRTSTEKYKSHPDNLKAVAAELGAGRVLEGSVQKAGEQVRINVQLIDAVADAHLWANTYDRSLKDVFAVESEVSQDIADALKAKLSPGEAGALASVPTHNSEAYDLFLKAEHQEHEADLAFREEMYLKAEDYYRQALALDPDFALAHAQFAYGQLIRHWFFFQPPTAAEADAIEATIARALALKPDLAAAHRAQAYFLYWVKHDYEPAVAEFQRGLELQPSDAPLLMGLAAVRRRQGRWIEALDVFRRAVAVAPLYSITIHEYALTFEYLRRYPEADREFSQALAADPGDARAMIYQYRNHLFGDGDLAAARRILGEIPSGTGILFDRLGGDVMSLVGYRGYADVIDRHFDAALAAWDAAPADTLEQKLQRQAARIAIQVLAGHSQAAHADCATLLEQLPHPEEAMPLTQAAWAQLCLGHGAEAVRLMQQAADLLPMSKDAYFGTFYQVGLAQVQAQAGQADGALATIQALLAVPAGGVLSLTRLKLDPVWDPLRKDARLQKLLTEGKDAPPQTPLQ